MYIILQGSVEKLSLDQMSNEIVSETVKLLLFTDIFTIEFSDINFSARGRRVFW